MSLTGLEEERLREQFLAQRDRIAALEDENAELRKVLQAWLDFKNGDDWLDAKRAAEALLKGEAK